MVRLQARQLEKKVLGFEGYDIRAGNPIDATAVYDIMSPEAEAVGMVVVKRPEKGKWYIGDIKAEPHKGYSPATYLAVLQSLPEGVGLRTEGVLPDDAKNIWQGLVAKGLAKPSALGGAPTGFETTYS